MDHEQLPRIPAPRVEVLTATARPASRAERGRVTALAATGSLLALALTAAIQAPQTSAAGAVAASATPLTVTQPAARQAQKPTVVLVHGAFADASGWKRVAGRLTRSGYDVVAPPNPLRGLDGDSAYLKSFLATIEGPIVLVGHSYGGAVITNAARGNPNVKALVYIAAYALARGETVGAANELGGHPEESLLLKHALPRPYPDAPEHDGQTDVDVYIDPAAFQEVFAADVSDKLARFMAVSQRPGSLFSLGTPSGAPAWKKIPSWYLVATKDHAVPPSAERAMAARAGATTWEVATSHVPMISRPGVVTRMIKAASTKTR